jgi:hypothetical protein
MRVMCITDCVIPETGRCYKGEEAEVPAKRFDEKQYPYLKYFKKLTAEESDDGN